MSAVSITANGNANAATEQTCGRFPDRRTNVRLIAAAMREAQRLWPQNTAAHVASHMDASTRAAEYWIAVERIPNAAAFLRLVMTTGRDGVAIIDAVANALSEAERESFWEGMSRLVRRMDAERRRDIANAEIAELRGPERPPRIVKRRRRAF